MGKKSKSNPKDRVLEAYRRIYNKFDTNGDQKVKIREIADALGIPESDARAAVKEVDKNNDGHCNFQEFYLLVKSEQKKLASASKESEDSDPGRWKSCFEAYDENGDGGIGLEEFISFFKEMDESMPTLSIELLYAASDSDGSGKIGFEEFARVLDFISQ